MMQTLGFCSKTKGEKHHVQHQNSTKEVLLSSLHILMRQLRNDDDEGSENVAKKNEFAFFQTLSRIFGFAQFVKWRRFFLKLNSQGIYPGS